MNRPRRDRRAIDGVLMFDKPAGWSSNQALQRVKHTYRAASAGHTGTLDPMATGLLPICLGEATKFAQGLLEADKAYTATLGLGVRTTTGDAEGDVVETRTVALTRSAIEGALVAFRGVITQVPPMHSALKRDGKPLYEYARRGEVVERAPRTVTIRRLTLTEIEGDCAVIEVICSKGTYVRTLAEDLGAALGCGAHLTALRRTGVGGFTLAGAVTLEALAAADETTRDGWLLPVDALVAGLERVDLDAAAARRFGQGQTVEAAGDAAATAGLRRVFGPGGRFLGLGASTSGRLAPSRLVAALQQNAGDSAEVVVLRGKTV